MITAQQWNQDYGAPDGSLDHGDFGVNQRKYKEIQ